MNKKQLLSEELKRFNLLNEYSFYVPEGDDPEGNTNDLILSEEDPEDGMEDLGAELDGDIDADVDAAIDVDADIEGEGDFTDPDMEGLDADVDADVDVTVEPEEEEVELDVTELVTSADEAKASADEANMKIDQLMGMVTKLEAQLNDVNNISNKIDNLENELEKRAPTPEEKIEMRSLDSYPYNLKLTDFWKTQEGKYDVLNTDEKETEEYTLTHDDIDSDYSEIDVRSSLDDTYDYDEDEI